MGSTGEVADGHPVLVGRARELAELRDAISRCIAGRGGCWLLTGDAGIGKTRLATEAAVYAESLGARALWARTWQGSGSVPYWPLIQVLRGVLAELGPDAWRQDAGRGARSLHPLLPEAGDAPSVEALDHEAVRFALLDALATFLGNVAQRRPLVLVFDDLQWADADTIGALGFLAGAAARMPVMIIGSYRDLEASADPVLAARLGELGRYGGSIPLRGLPRDDVGRLIEQASGDPPDGSAIDLVHTATGGNPFFANEVIRILLAEGRIHDARGAPLEISEGIRATIGRRVEALPEHGRDLLTIAAVAGRTFPVQVVADVAGRDGREVEDLLARAVEQRLLAPGEEPGWYEFVHDLVRESLYQAMPPARRSRLHRLVGESLERADATEHVTEIAHHLLAALPDGDAERAAGYARLAGDRAASRLAYEDAAAHYERALRALGGSSSLAVCDLSIAAGEARHRAGHTEIARAHCHRAAEIARNVGDVERLALAALTLGRFGFAGARIMSGLIDDEVISLLEEAQRALPPGDGVLRARVLARLASALYWIEQDAERRDRLTREAIEMAHRIGDDNTLAHVLLNRYFATWGPHNAEERLETATRVVEIGQALGDDELVLQGRHLRLTSLLELGRADEFEHEVEAQARVGERLGQRAYLLHAETLLHLMRGRPVDALERAERTTRMWTGVLGQHYWAEQWMGVQIFLNTWSLGRPEDLIPVGEQLVQRFPTVDVWKAALAWMRCEAGHEAAARDAFDALARDDFASVRRNWNYIVHMAMVAWTCARLGDVERAAILYELLRPLEDRSVIVTDAGGWLGPMAHHLGMLAAAMGRLDEAEAHFQRAIDACRRFGARPWLARAGSEYARMLLRRDGPGDRDRALELVSRALAVARELGLGGLEREAEAMLAGAGSSVREPEARVFRREGDVWTIVYGTTTSRMRDSKGMRYLSYLLQHPGVELHALQLVALVEGGATRGDTGRDVPVGAGDATDPILDDEAKDAYRARIDDLRDAIEEAEDFGDDERAARAREELERITEELGRAVGLGGRDRTMAIASERARINVTRVIRRAIDAIGDADRPLADHLGAAVQTGTYFSYNPARAELVSWEQ